MDNRFTPRSNEEMLAAVRAFQARQRQWYEESDERLARFDELAAFLKKPIV